MIPYRAGRGLVRGAVEAGGVLLHRRPREVAIVPACLDSLLIGLYVLADELFIDRRGPGRPRKITAPSWSAWPSRRAVGPASVRGCCGWFLAVGGFGCVDHPPA